MSPVGSHMERVTTQDDLIPLRFPLVTNTGETLTTIRIEKGQVRLGNSGLCSASNAHTS